MKTELTQEELDYIFTRKIRPSFDRKIARFPEATPALVMVGAQPGAGKSRSMTRVLSEYPGAIPVIGDDFRAFHPSYDDLMLSPETALQMPQVTAQASGRWVEMSIEYLRSRGAPVIVETTMRQPDVVARTMGEFHKAGYYCEARVLAVPHEVSLLGVVERYARQVLENGAGRWAPAQMHDAAYKNLPHSLENLANSGVVDRIVVTNRGGKILYDTATRDFIDILDICHTIEHSRNFRFYPPTHHDQWNADLLQVKTILTQTGETNTDVLATIAKLEENKPQPVQSTRRTMEERMRFRKAQAMALDPEAVQKIEQELRNDTTNRGLSR